MELTRHQRFLVILHDKEGRLIKQIARTEALDLAVEASNTTKRKAGEYVTVYLEVGVSR